MTDKGIRQLGPDPAEARTIQYFGHEVGSYRGASQARFIAFFAPESGAKGETLSAALRHSHGVTVTTRWRVVVRHVSGEAVGRPLHIVVDRHR